MAIKKSKSTSKQNTPEPTKIGVRFLKSESSAAKTITDLINPVTDVHNQKIETPPLDLQKLAAIFEVSSSLRPNIDAYVTNVYAQGYIFEPALDLNAPDAAIRISEALYVEALLHAHDLGESTDISQPTEEEIKKRIATLRKQALLELAIVRRFFSGCFPDGSFVDLLKITGQNVETTGNAFWEVLRGKKGRPKNLKYVPSVTMRIGRGSPDTDGDVPVFIRQSLTEISQEVVKIRRTFKRFTQVDDANQPVTWFKEFGDPRVMSRKTGDYYINVQALIKAEKKKIRGKIKDVNIKDLETELVATEVFHFSIPSLVSLYGMPRWSGNIPAVLGSRELDETNLDYFLSNAIPALALLCSGGRLGANLEERLKEFFTEEVRGRQSTHKLIVLEAETQRHSSVGPTQNPRLEFVPLRNAQQQDALFQNYDERNALKVGRSFRHPISITGGTKFNIVDLRFAEEQIYQPERESLDSKINKFLLPELGVYFWKIKSNSAMARDPEILSNAALRAVAEGVIVPAEARDILERVFNRELPVIKAIWATQPVPLTLAALGIAAGPAEAVREQGRQDGFDSPQNLLLASLGLRPEEAAIIDPSDENSGTQNFDQQSKDFNILGAIQAMQSLNAGQSNSKDDDEG